MHDDTRTSSKFQLIGGYLARGFALVPLHHMIADPAGRARCSCRLGGDPAHDHKQGGKHPVDARWQLNPHRTDTYWRTHPEANVGIATGVASGMWALDYDPGTADMRTAQLVSDLGTHEGFLPVVRTGGGGEHWWFALPVDALTWQAWEPPNSQGKIAPGLDVRGMGGQVVAPPSVSGKGAYVPLNSDWMRLELRRAPVWLEELVRPREYESSPSQASISLPPGSSIPEGERGPAYAAEAMRLQCGELARAAPGTRNGTAFKVAARLIELANSGWLHELGARDAYLGAAKTAHVLGMASGDGFPEREALAVWESARRHVGDRTASLPPDDLHGEAVPFVSPGATGPNGVTAGTAGVNGSAVATALPGLSTSLTATGNGVGSGSGPNVLDPFSDPVSGRVSGSVSTQVSDVLALPTQSYLQPVDNSGDSPGLALLREFMSPDMLRALPPPRPLVNGVLDLDSTSWIIGKSGSYKSFVALDIAGHVGTGRMWQGRRVHGGTVAYLAAEGGTGMRLRVDAWERRYGPMDNVWFLSRPVQAKGGEWNALIDALSMLGPVLVIIDTQSRVTIGLEETSNTDMGFFVEQADRIRQATRACVLTVHHIGRTGGDARGASVIDGAQDTELKVEKTGTLLARVVMDKQKDQAQVEPIRLGLEVVDGGIDPETGRDLSSLVVLPEPSPLAEESGEGLSVETRRTMALYRIMRDDFGRGNGATEAMIRAQFMSLSDVKALSDSGRRSAWGRSWGYLTDHGLLMRKHREKLYKVYIVGDQSQDGVLTPNLDGEPEDSEWYIWRGEDKSDKKVRLKVRLKDQLGVASQDTSQRSSP